MSSNWPIVRIEDIKADRKNAITIGPFGSRMKSDCYTESGIAVIRGTNLGPTSHFINDFVYITEEKADELASCNVYKNDLVFPHRGSIGEVGIVESEQRYVLSSSLMKLTCATDKACPKFIYYFFKSSTGRHELLKNASQVGTPGIGQPLASLKSIELSLPPLKTQECIAKILSSLDEKIYINQMINQTLEQMAQAMFKSWFVDFEPVKAKIAVLNTGGSQEDATLAAMSAISGKSIRSLDIYKHEHPTKYEELRITANLFPNTLVESEIGEIPEGWESARLSDIAILNYGKALKKTERIDGPYPVYGSGGVTGFHNNYLVTGPGIIIGRKGTIGTIYWEDSNFFPIDTVYYVVNKKDTSLYYLYYLLQTLNLPNMNTDAAVPGLNRENVYRLSVLKPKECIIECYSKYVSVFRESINANKKTNETIITTRNKILPKLFSGELSSQEFL
ncbi:TPA: restriction endonuclease subunit S [Klebsiella pneumoniae]|nr:restriction endonuclease subunit S [Klebsiella pneumoniae]